MIPSCSLGSLAVMGILWIAVIVNAMERQIKGKKSKAPTIPPLCPICADGSPRTDIEPFSLGLESPFEDPPCSSVSFSSCAELENIMLRFTQTNLDNGDCAGFQRVAHSVGCCPNPPPNTSPNICPFGGSPNVIDSVNRNSILLSDYTSCAELVRNGDNSLLECGCPIPTDLEGVGDPDTFCPLCADGSDIPDPNGELLPNVRIGVELKNLIHVFVIERYNAAISGGSIATATQLARQTCTELQNTLAPYLECPNYDLSTEPTNVCRICGANTRLPDYHRSTTIFTPDGLISSAPCGQIELFSKSFCSFYKVPEVQDICCPETLTDTCTEICEDGMPFEEDPNKLLGFNLLLEPLTCKRFDDELSTISVPSRDIGSANCNSKHLLGEIFCGCRGSFSGGNPAGGCPFCPDGSVPSPDFMFETTSVAGCRNKCVDVIDTEENEDCAAVQVAAVTDCGCPPVTEENEALALCESVLDLAADGYESVEMCTKALRQGTKSTKSAKSAKAPKGPKSAKDPKKLGRHL